ncbi:MAG: methylated-DNA--[protein]-cysteine S-methyltransferase [Reyranellaceae bacterium]
MTAYLDTPIGRLSVDADGGAVTKVRWIAPDVGDPLAPDGDPVVEEARRQLQAYFDRKLTMFDLPLLPKGTEAEKQIWQVMCKIPYGQTMTYGEMTVAVGRDPRQGDARDIGKACSANPIPVIIPCHRVMAAGGRMGGYSGRGGTETKRKLLAFEGALLL